MTNHIITLENCRSYSTQANLEKALDNWRFNSYRADINKSPCRYVICKTPDDRWTAIFLLSEHFRINKTGGYLGVFSDRGFMTI